MRSPFAALPERVVTLKREVDGVSEPLTFDVTLRPWPLGFPDVLGRMFPAPVKYVNTQPVADSSREAEHAALRIYILLAACMGEQLDAKAPSVDANARPEDSRKLWEVYANAVKAELAAAHLVEGDVHLLAAEANRLNSGAGRIPKA